MVLLFDGTDSNYYKVLPSSLKISQWPSVITQARTTVITTQSPDTAPVWGIPRARTPIFTNQSTATAPIGGDGDYPSKNSFNHHSVTSYCTGMTVITWARSPMITTQSLATTPIGGDDDYPSKNPFKHHSVTSYCTGMTVITWARTPVITRYCTGRRWRWLLEPGPVQLWLRESCATTFQVTRCCVSRPATAF